MKSGLAVRPAVSRPSASANLLETGLVVALSASLSCLTLVRVGPPGLGRTSLTSTTSYPAPLDSPRAEEWFSEELTHAEQAIQESDSTISTSNDRLVTVLTQIMGKYDPNLVRHAGQVASYATVLARELGLEAGRIYKLWLAARLHDIGKLSIPRPILLKKAPLSRAEYKLVKTHPVVGARLFGASAALGFLAPIIRSHHERWDGRGYPDGLVGETIPLEARILTVADTVEAMASDRPHHSAVSRIEILGELERCAGGQLDPLLAHQFIRIVERAGPEFIVNSTNKQVKAQASNHVRSSPSSREKTTHSQNRPRDWEFGEPG